MLDIEAIRRALPHRYPFLLIDRIEELEDGHVVATKNVTVNEPFEAVMPGVLILEAMAQTAAFLVPRPDGDGPLEGYLVGVDKARFRRKVVPGDRLRLEAKLVRARHGLLQADVAASVEGEPAASATMSLLTAEAAAEGRS